MNKKYMKLVRIFVLGILKYAFNKFSLHNQYGVYIKQQRTNMFSGLFLRFKLHE